MTLDEALEHWQRQRARLQAIDAWIDEGKPIAPRSLGPLLAQYQELKKPEAKRALKEAREDSSRDAFIRMFSSFEQEFRAAFCTWLARQCGSDAPVADVAKALPEAIRSLLKMAEVLEPNIKSKLGFTGNVMQRRNDLIHRGFVGTMPFDLVDLHRDLSAVVGFFDK